MAVTFNAGVVEPVRASEGGPPLEMGFPEGSAQTFKKGDLLILSSGQVIIAVSGPLSAGIVGVACHDASGTQGTTVLVSVASQTSHFIANFGTVSAGAFTGTAVPTSVVGTVGTLTRATTQVLPSGTITLPTARWVFDTSVATSNALNVAGATNNARVIIIGADSRDGIQGTDLGGRVHFVFLDVVFNQVGVATITPIYPKAFPGI